MTNSIAWRKEKVGFESPTSSWMQNRSQFTNLVNSSEFVRKLVKGGRIEEDFDLLWKLINLSLWAEEFDVSLD